MRKNVTPSEERFYNFLRKNPLESTYNCFAAAVWGRNLPEDKLKKLFNTLVDPEDYIGEDKDKVFRNLCYLNQEAVYIDLIPEKLTNEETNWFKIRNDEYLAYLSPWLKKEFTEIHLSV